MNKNVNWILSIYLFISIIISGCEFQNDKTKPSQQKVTETQSRHVGYLRLPLSDEVITLDPGLIYRNVEIEVVEQLFLGLTGFNAKTNKVVPELAIDWQVSETGRVYTYQLRQDIKWTNGVPVTAHDIVWALQRNIAQQTDSLYAFMLYALKNAKQIHQNEFPASSLGVRAVDDYTVEFTLEQPTSYFPALTSFPIYAPLPRQVIEKHGDDWIQPANIQTNGPYKLVEWNPKRNIILKRNPNYYRAIMVKISEVHYSIIRDSSLAFAMYKKNELDILGGQTYLPIPSSKMASIQSHPILRKEKQISPQFCTEWYGFTVQQPPLDNPLVRKAIVAAIDKKTLMDIVLKTNHFPALTITRPPDVDVIDLNVPKKTGIAFDPIDAKEWLANAGYPDGKSFPKLFLVHNSSELHQKTASAIKTMLKHYLNINVEIRAFDFERYLSILKQPDTPLIFRRVWCANYPDAHDWLYQVFHPDKGMNWIGWNNSEFTELVDNAQQTSNQTIRKQLYQKAEKILTETETAIIPLYFYNTSFLVKPWVKGWYHKGFGGQDIHNWSLKN
jgi:oligopeptide transport system substrate-binding protein